MPLDKQTLKKTLMDLFQKDTPPVGDSFTSEQAGKMKKKTEDIATAIADAIDIFVKSGTITVNVNATVATTGTPAAQTGTAIQVITTKVD